MKALALALARTSTAITPATFTDRTCFAVTGLTWRQFAAFALANDVPIAKAGRRSIVRLDRYLAAVDRQAGAERSPAWTEDNVVAMATRRGTR